MLQYLPYLVFAGVAVQFVGIGSYIKETLTGNTKPNKVTWLMWAIAPLIATVAAISDGVGLAVLPVFMSGFGPLLVFLASLVNKKSYWKLEKFDYACGAFSLMALILWLVTKEPNVAILFAILSDLLAAFPTLAKAWKHPETETVGPFAAGLFSALTTFGAITIWNFSNVAFATYLVAINICLIFSIYGRKLLAKKSK